MFKKKKNQNNDDVVTITKDVQKFFKVELSDDVIQTTFNDDESIYEDAENIEEVETDENENNETE